MRIQCCGFEHLLGRSASRPRGAAGGQSACARVCVCVCVRVCPECLVPEPRRVRWQFSGDPCDLKLPTGLETLEADWQQYRFAPAFQSDMHLQWTDRRGSQVKVRMLIEFSPNSE